MSKPDGDKEQPKVRVYPYGLIDAEPAYPLDLAEGMGEWR